MIGEETRIGVIGLGYVGLPLAAEFGKKHDVVGFDLKENRIAELRKGIDNTLEVDSAELSKARLLRYSTSIEDLRDRNFFIIAVPTPVDRHNIPDLTPLVKASVMVGKVLKKGDIVVYESTVYPGCTEEDCVPLLERESGLKFNEDFFCGYSPERINPGDKEHTLTKIKKIVSGSTRETAEKVDEVYSSVITAGTYMAPSIKVAEAAKVIENTQRDINIAFMNELSMIFNIMGIDTQSVLKAASTKWNFLNFKPGLVGGHCIGVDPFYLTFKAQECGYHPEIILAGRRINDSMGSYIARECIKLMIKKDAAINRAKVLVLGITFKENCPDIRNTKVVDIIKELKEFGCIVDVSDPWADKKEAEHEYGLLLKDMEELEGGGYGAVIIAVAHDEFAKISVRSFLGDAGVLYDVKGVMDSELADGRL